MTIGELRTLVDAGEFHHATYRCVGSLWEGLWIYKHAPGRARDFEPAGAFLKGSADLDEAHNICVGSGISVGAYGAG